MSESSVALAVYREPISARMEYAKALAASQLLPAAYVRQPQNVLVAMEAGAALGLPPIQALTSINVIKGKPAVSADLMAAVIRKAGHKLRVESDDQHCTATVIRADDPDAPMSVTWDEAKARRAGLWGNRGPWSQYPAAMLRARAISEVARMAANDALMGVIYTEEELADSTPVAVSSEQVPPSAQPQTQDVPEPEPPVWNGDSRELMQDQIVKAAQFLDLTAAQLQGTIAYATKRGRCEYAVGTTPLEGLSNEQLAVVRAYLVQRLNELQGEKSAGEPAPEGEVLDVEVFEEGEEK